jgi:hypothetical protein
MVIIQNKLKGRMVKTPEVGVPTINWLPPIMGVAVPPDLDKHTTPPLEQLKTQLKTYETMFVPVNETIGPDPPLLNLQFEIMTPVVGLVTLIAVFGLENELLKIRY